MTTVPELARMTGADLRSFDPFGAHASEAYRYFALARAERPVFFTEAVGAWCVTRYADVRAAAMDTAVFSSRDVFPRPTGLPEAAQKVVDFYFENATVTMLDPPAHGPVRRSLHESFAPRAIRGYEPAVRDTIARRVAAIGDPDRFDLVAEFSAVFPLAVIMRVLGLPEDDLDDVRRWVDNLLAVYLGHSFRTEEELTALGTDVAAGFDHFLDLVDRRTREPGDDLVSYMIHNEVGGQSLTAGQIANNVFNLIAAGNETTGSALVNIVRRLLAEPGRWDALVAGELDLDVVVNEGLRLDPPVLGLFRTATRDVHLGGADIAAGDRVLLLYASANHDDALVDEPAAFRLDRTGRPGLSFGHGVHTCVGAPLARLELRVALELLAARFPTLRRADDTPLAYKPLAQVHSPTALWLTTT